MPLQNRIDPWGDLVAIKARGEFLGNRGILHDDDKNIVKPWAHKNWVTCELSFKGIKRELFGPNSYSELFFLDEATALAAGHRPCAHCRRQRYNEFKRFWGIAIGLLDIDTASVSSQEIDKRLHSERASRSREKILFNEKISEVPEGALIALGDEVYLVWGGHIHKWSHHGYSSAQQLPSNNQVVQVITPQTIVQMYKVGFKPLVHASIHS